MGTPDILGTYGDVLVLHVGRRPRSRGPIAGGAIVTASTSTDGVVRGTLDGPDNPLLQRAARS